PRVLGNWPFRAPGAPPQSWEEATEGRFRANVAILGALRPKHFCDPAFQTFRTCAVSRALTAKDQLVRNLRAAYALWMGAGLRPKNIRGIVTDMAEKPFPIRSRDSSDSKSIFMRERLIL